MFAECRHRVHAWREGGAGAGRQQGWNGASRGFDRGPAVACGKLGMGPDVGHVVQAGVGYSRLIETAAYFGDAQICKGRGDNGPEGILVGGAAGVGIEARVSGEAGLGQHLGAEYRPFAIVLEAEHHGLAVARRKWAVGVDRGMRCAGAWWRGGAVEGVVERVAHPFDHGFQHGHVDVAALSGFAALDEGCEDACLGVHAGCDIGDGAAGLGRVIGRAGDRDETGFGLDEQVVGLLVPVRSIRAIARDIADDEPWVAFAQRIVGEAEACRGTRGEVLDQHVGMTQELGEDGLGGRVLDVEGEAFLRPVGPDEMGGESVDALVVAAGEVAAIGPLDLDDAGAEFGKLARAEGRCDRVFEGQHCDAVEGAHCCSRSK